MATPPRGTGGREKIRALGGITFDNGVHMLPPAAGAPTDGASGTGAGYAGPGSLYINITAGKLYTNTGTAASPTWTVVGSQS